MRGADLVGLTVLALLSVKDSHPYELQRLIVATHKDYVTGLPRSLYHAVERLDGSQLIEPAETVRDGRRPERTVYRITDEGRGHLAGRLRNLIEVPDPDRRGFVAAVSLLGCLPAATARKSLRTRAAVITGTVTGLAEQVAALRGEEMPDVVLLELEYELAVQRAELDWIGTVLDRIERGELDWSGTARLDLLDDVLREPAETELRKKTP
ncbi:PadR family transcriptional regulator [Nonomuraea longispora]|uniref:PadR family transcriptional regulator n=1 Tax=Nonomuraea longispora TaxID=1848320 RepID=A0A4R4N8P3_9ACTN|nr:PadR family transcriptional regulator [Nonomuraea longispora]TDC03683.1 PadR family transcriptional regulator [Nonomuraea longispora]